MINSAESPIDIIHSARDGTNDYDFDSLVDLEGGSQGQISLIKCKIDGKVYAVKQLTALKHEEGDDIESEVATELIIYASFNHPLILPILDVIKDPKGYYSFIFPKFDESLKNFLERKGTLTE